MLNKRLQAIAQMLKPCEIVADIGCDHAFLAIYLIENEIAKKVYATDVADGPLNIAKTNVALSKLNDKIECRLSNGFENIPDDLNAAIIAGMGYHTAKMILENAINRLERLGQIIVQINTDVELFRKWLSDNCYTIEDEKIVFDRKYYTIIKFNTKKFRALTDDEIEFGPCLLIKQEPEFIEYIQNKLLTFKMIAKKITTDVDKKNMIAKKIKQYEFVLDNIINKKTF